MLTTYTFIKSILLYQSFIYLFYKYLNYIIVYCFLFLILEYLLINEIFQFDSELFLLLILLFISGIIIIISDNFLTLFVGLELQTLIFLTLLLAQIGNNTIRLAFNYMTYNVFFSFLFLITILVFLLKFNSLEFININNYYNNYYFFGWEYFIIIIIILFKLNLFPYYLWVIDIFSKSSFYYFLTINILSKYLIFIVLLKIMTLVYYNYALLLINNWLIIIILLSLFIGSLKLYVFQSIKEFFIFGGLIHFSWIMLGFINYNLHFFDFYIYMLLYFYNQIIIFFIFNFYLFVINYKQINFSIIYLTHLNNFKYINKPLNNILSLFIASLAALPPFLGFFLKLLLIKTTLIGFNSTAILLLFFISLISVYIYFKILKYLLIDNTTLLNTNHIVYLTSYDGKLEYILLSYLYYYNLINKKIDTTNINLYLTYSTRLVYNKINFIVTALILLLFSIFIYNGFYFITPYFINIF